MLIRFWGTRGSIAKPGASTVRYGGNTSCVEVRADDGTLMVLDCGTGAHGLGASIVGPGETLRGGHLLVGHTHWDHIQGFPFFAPLFAADQEWHVYGPGRSERHLEEALLGQMSYPYFPITQSAFAATLHYHDLGEGSFQVGSIRVTTRFLNHPALTLGYRLEAGGASVVYATDHEPHGIRGPGPMVHLEDLRHAEFLAGADLVVHDTQYTLEEYPGRVGWGHTPAERAVDFAVAAGIRRLALFHHDPGRDDASVDRLAHTCSLRAAQLGSGLEVFAAAEGQAISLAERGSAGPKPASASAYLRSPKGADRVVIFSDPPELAPQLESPVLDEGAQAIRAPDVATVLARLSGVDLVLLVQRDAPSAIALCRMLRAQRGDVPILLMTEATLSDAQIAEAFAAGVSDYLMLPLRPTYLRARVSTWLARARP